MYVNFISSQSQWQSQDYIKQHYHYYAAELTQKHTRTAAAAAAA